MGRGSEPHLSTVVIETVSEQEGVDPTELRDPLFKTINSDALNSLFRDGNGKVVFEYHGYEVTVDSNGTAEVTAVRQV